MIRCTEEEWMQILRSLEEHHAVFYRLWQIGRPIFTEDVDTAAIQFDKLGKFVNFLFNPDFWDGLDVYNRLFIICHECLHVLLNHGLRIKDSSFSNRLACNQCLDVVVNHLLVDNFNFDRSKILNQESYCWIDTVFTGYNVPKNETFEYYYNIFEKSYGDGSPSMDLNVLDDHEALTGFDNNQPLEGMDQLLSSIEKNSLISSLGKHAGLDGSANYAILFSKPKTKKKWESVIKNWSNKVQNKFKEQEQWARINRRLASMPQNIVLPSDMEIEDDSFEKLRVSFFMDTSGSCWHLKERFFSAALSLDSRVFEVSLFCFDATVYAVTANEKKIYGGGGTSFSSIEEFLQNQPKYPDAIFVITDGYGGKVFPKFPNRWFWFLSENSGKEFSKGGFVYNLSDFE